MLAEGSEAGAGTGGADFRWEPRDVARDKLSKQVGKKGLNTWQVGMVQALELV